MQHVIGLNGSFFNTQRMLREYMVKAYLSYVGRPNRSDGFPGVAHAFIERSTAPRGAAASVGQESLEIFGLLREAIVRRAQVWAILHGERIHFCPHALGWRGDEAYVQALVLQERRENVIEGGTWQWLPSWQWVRLADLEIPVVRRGEWITCPPEQRPELDFLTLAYCVAP
jgi:hypothetical protein